MLIIKKQEHHHCYAQSEVNHSDNVVNNADETDEFIEENIDPVDVSNYRERELEPILSKYRSCLLASNANETFCQNYLLENMKNKYEECIISNSEMFCKDAYNSLKL